MRESRVIAMAGVLQACRLVRDVATQGRADAVAVQTSLASVFRFDADSAADVFGGLNGLRSGLETLLDQFENDKRDLTLTQLVLGVLRLERKLSRRPAMLRELRGGIESIQRQVDHLGVAHTSVQARLAELYVATLSQLRPRVVVHGNPLQLADAQKVEQIRALLLAAVRAAVLWRQVGGSQLRLLMRRREYAMLARGLLSRSTLDRG
ncbi:high frequency lysogenization protein HflD [Dokdonella sp.]|uniref:high frequency lysogenization protein HflD n=1 Tax=Dokdonella sp. TaxID=2291710 RepID=UPI001B10F36D|nr:high frequency lysogenization protein HflD [Dokdonella sp.]MBO9663126.1 high frequency lysogenization protein HflD [Dokdonella sp.]